MLVRRWWLWPCVLCLCACADDVEFTDGSSTQAESGDPEASSSTTATAGQSDASASSSDTATSTGGSAGSAGCGYPPVGEIGSLEIGGQTRTFVMRVPSSYTSDRPYPVIFAWHGLGGSGNLAERYFGLQAQAGEDAIIFYPDALPLETQGGQTGWDLDPDGIDVAFFDVMVNFVQAHYCVDTDRIFSTGHSFGGYISNALGCARGDVLRAIAPVAGGGPFGSPDCAGQVSAWLAHGTADTTVEISQGEGSRDLWLERNACQTATQPTDPAPCVAYDACEVVWCVHEGGHEWPDFAAEGIWSFFRAL